ncbi:hypothetical protein SRABI106_02741 [Rahnella aquatilis]|nr:hypothetical protein SRABI106_02741 [Rahnella aquatilis]
MNARLFDVLHDTANQHALTVADSINVNFYGVVKETVQQNRCVVRHADGVLEVTAQVDFVVYDFHRAATQNIRRTYHQRITDTRSFLNSLFDSRDCGVCRLFQAQTVNRLLETFTVFGAVDGIRAGADNWHASGFQFTRQFQRSLAAVLNNHAFRLFDTHDFQHVFQSDGFEVQAVRGIIIGRHSFRVTVNHDGFVTVLTQRQRGVYAAIIELDTLTDTVWTTAQHHDFWLIIGRVRFTLFFIRGVHVGGIGREFRRTGINTFVDRMQVVFVTQFAHFAF